QLVQDARDIAFAELADGAAVTGRGPEHRLLPGRLDEPEHRGPVRREIGGAYVVGREDSAGVAVVGGRDHQQERAVRFEGTTVWRVHEQRVVTGRIGARHRLPVTGPGAGREALAGVAPDPEGGGLRPALERVPRRRQRPAAVVAIVVRLDA